MNYEFHCNNQHDQSLWIKYIENTIVELIISLPLISRSSKTAKCTKSTFMNSQSYCTANHPNPSKQISKQAAKYHPIEALQLIDINPYLLPILSLKLNQCHSLLKRASYVLLNLNSSLSMDYYNIQNGFWEPILEPFRFSVNLVTEQDGKHKMVTFEGPNDEVPFLKGNH